MVSTVSASEPAPVAEKPEPPPPAPVTRSAPAEAPPPSSATVVRPTTDPVDQAAAQAFDDGSMPDLLGEAGPAADPAVQAAPHLAEGQPETLSLPEPVPAIISESLDRGIDWDRCDYIAGSPNIRLEAEKGPDAGPIEVSADSAVAQFSPRRTQFSGNVRLSQDEMRMNADELTVNRDSGEVDAQGNVVVVHPELRIAGSAARYQLESGQGEIDQASYRIVPMRARGDADQAQLLGGGKSQYRNINFTTCRPGNSDWQLTAETLELDRIEGLGTASHAKLRFFDVPVLYTPTLTFPIDNRRRSGLLIPSVGYRDSTGFDLSVPYYLNLAENYDLTLAPRVMSKRGLMLGGEFRFLTETTEGSLTAEFLPNDSEYDGDSDDRGAASMRSVSWLNPRTSAHVRLNYVTDDDYLRDLGNNLAATSTSNLERAGELRYHADTWDLLGRVQYYQTVDDQIPDADRPYSRLPQLLMLMEDPEGLSGTTYHLGAEYVYFHRKDSTKGHRVALAPAISLPLRETWGYLEPKIGARYVGYNLSDEDPGIDDSASTLTGMLSLDSGLYFDRNTSFFGNGVTQTLEPRLFYLYVPEEDQDDQPVFDTGLFDFSFDNLFRENRFNGADRIGDANQLTLALTSRMISDNTGAELLRASVGQIIYFEDREVTLPGQMVEDDSSSAIAAELAAKLGGGWYTRAGLQWDPHDSNTDQSLAQLGYRDDENHVFNAAYRLRDGVTEQTDLAVFWPLNEQWSLVARHNYSLQEDRLIEALAGVEYGRCCWKVRAIARKLTDGDGNDHNMSFMLQLELNGLGRFGDDIDNALERSIYGYGTDR